MLWNDHSKDFPKDAHAFLSPSTPSWCNYTDDKLLLTYINKLAAVRGTAIHELAQKLVLLKVRLPDEQKTLNLYVNDVLDAGLCPERKLVYSRFCFGTADAIGVKDGRLRIYDLKTGKHKAPFVQLEVYAALFFLEYQQFKPGLTDIELRIYQSDEIRIENPETETIVSLMDRIIRFDRIINQLEAEYDEGFDTFWSGS